MLKLFMQIIKVLKKSSFDGEVILLVENFVMYRHDQGSPSLNGGRGLRRGKF